MKLRRPLFALVVGASACNGDDDRGSNFGTTGGESNEDTGEPTSSSGAATTAATTGPDAQGESSSSTGGLEPPVNYDVYRQPGGADENATLFGTVWAPNGEIPVSGALVYTSPNEPDGIPQGVYCAECEALGRDDHFTTTAADGSFVLNTDAESARWLVVTKGQFMRITEIDVEEGDTTLADEVTTLPDFTDPARGLYMPRIAVGNGAYDRLEDALGKFGLGDTMISSSEERLVPGTESFDIWHNGEDPAGEGFTSQGTLAELVADPARMAEYHIIFLPCTSDDYLDALDNPQNVQNIRDWVAAGGRWYVADWANEWLIQVFPEYQKLQGELDGDTDLSSYDSTAEVLDDDLLSWLTALPEPLKDINPLNDEAHPTLLELPSVQTNDNFSAVIGIPPVIVQDDRGNNVNVGHKVWLEGPGLDLGVHPLTVTGQFGCGRIQFTSYHTAQFFNYVGLSPQELVLIYTILEIGTCQAALPPPQG